MISSYIWSTVAYGREDWTINREVRNKINAFECWVYRIALKTNWKDRKNGDRNAFTQFYCKEESCILWTYL